MPELPPLAMPIVLRLLLMSTLLLSWPGSHAREAGRAVQAAAHAALPGRPVRD